MKTKRFSIHYFQIMTQEIRNIKSLSRKEEKKRRQMY